MLSISQDILVCLEPDNVHIETRDAIIPPNEVGCCRGAERKVICKQLEKIKSELWDMINYILTVK